MTTHAAVEPVARWRALFEETRPSAGAMPAERAAAFARFAELGFPAAREEAWKYTSLRRLEGRSFVPVTREQALAREPAPAAPLAPLRAVLVNGYLHEASSDLAGLPQGMRLSSLGGGSAGERAATSWLRIPSGGGTERFAALNAALCGDALLIEVDASVRAATALHLLLDAVGDGPSVSHPRVLVKLAPDAGLKLVVQYRGDNRAERFVNTVIDIEAGERSELRLYRLQQQGAKSFQIERIEAALDREARLIVNDASLGASLARLDLQVRLLGRGASTELTGLFLADETRHLDTQLRVEHAATDTASLQDYRGIAAGRGRGVINSKAVVNVGAQKSRTQQTSRNLLLTPGAEIDTKPELEIRADDVQCNHGATTGQLDPAALFYLRSRGLDEGAARNVLIRAFAGPVLSRIDLPSFAQAVHREFDSRLDRLLMAPS
ncbi:MAG TPA: Fe-S cluster assembly protein SufD [Steroidobacteraceae bacterium]